MADSYHAYQDLQGFERFSKNRIASLWMAPDRGSGWQFTSSSKFADSSARPRDRFPQISWRVGRRGLSPSEFKRYLQISIGSCNECKFWLELTRNEGYLGEKESGELSDRFGLLDAMLKSLSEALEKF